MNSFTCDIPRVLISALKGGAGKTLITLGLIASLRRRGLKVSVFKKGPDYIDSNWLGFAANSPCYNLDSFLMGQDVIIDSFVRKSAKTDIAIIEGARGLFDGVDSSGSYSTAELAKTLGAPTLLIIEGSKMSGTAAALTRGCQVLDPGLMLEGVILNRVAGSRHEDIMKSAVMKSCGIPTVGSIAKQTFKNFPQRHLGLLPIEEHPAALSLIEQVEAVISKGINLDKIVEIANKARKLEITRPDLTSEIGESFSGDLRIGFLKDSAFQFYYHDNLDALEATGASLISVSALDDQKLPDIHGLYIGGGFPETNAEALAANHSFKASLVEAVANGLPVYAECGGLMYLSKKIILDEKEFPMVGVFPITTVLKKKPQGLGYTEVEVTGKNPFYPLGKVIRGHEFHYSSVELEDSAAPVYAFRIIRGHGMDGVNDGICVNNAMGSYLHVHALGVPYWARAIAKRAFQFKLSQKKQ